MRRTGHGAAVALYLKRGPVLGGRPVMRGSIGRGSSWPATTVPGGAPVRLVSSTSTLPGVAARMRSASSMASSHPAWLKCLRR